MIGETIGSYRILSQLGAGAMGEVYLAEHRHLKRKAALKLLAHELVGRPDLLERFFLEARATSAIAHPGIVQIFDCETDASGRPYIVMEYIEGQTLAAVLARGGALSPTIAARVARGIAEAIAAAHATGIIHRDLKPDNVFVRLEPAVSIKLVDFGIAKLAGDFRAGQVHQTRTGVLMGTPLYMSPEQCRDSAATDARTDLYSLGCVLFEMLTGQPPFTLDTMGELIVAHLTVQPRDVRALRPAIPEALARLVAELLNKEPNDRPADMNAVSERLAAFVIASTTIPDPAPAGAMAGTLPPAARAAGSLAPGAASQPGVATTPPSATTPPAGPARTTFGDAASEKVDLDTLAGASAPPSRRIWLGLGAVVVAAAIVVVVVSRLGDGGARGSATAGARSAGAPEEAAREREGELARQTDPHQAEHGTGQGAGDKLGGRERAGQKKTVASAEPDEAEGGPGKHGKGKHGGGRAMKGQGANVHGTDAKTAGTTAGVNSATSGPDKPKDGNGNAAPTSPAASTGATLAGAWEGPWTDSSNHQEGRLFLQVAADGAAVGWLNNRAANQSFRMSGRLSATGAVDLTCQCPPGQAFSARGTFRAGSDDLKGQLALSSGTGTFGHSQVSLKRRTHGAGAH